MRNRCARLAHLARGDPTETLPAVSGGGNDDVAASVERRWQEEGHGDEWMEATVQEAAAAMKAGRRRALEQEIERQVLLARVRGLRFSRNGFLRLFRHRINVLIDSLMDGVVLSHANLRWRPRAPNPC